MTGPHIKSKLAVLTQQAVEGKLDLSRKISDAGSSEDEVVVRSSSHLSNGPKVGAKESEQEEAEEKPVEQPPNKPKPRAPVPQSPAVQLDEVETFKPASSDEDSQGDEGDDPEYSAGDE